VSVAFVGVRKSACRFFVPAIWRTKWRASGGRILRQATADEMEAARTLGENLRPVPLDALLAAQALASDRSRLSPLPNVVSDDSMLKPEQPLSKRKR